MDLYPKSVQINTVCTLIMTRFGFIRRNQCLLYSYTSTKYRFVKSIDIKIFLYELQS